MKKALLISCLLIISEFLNAQNSLNKKWELSTSSAFMFSYRQLIDKNEASSNEPIITLRNEDEIRKETYGFRTKISYKLFKNLRIGSGVELINLGWKTRKIDLVVSIPDPMAPEAFRSRDNYFYLGFPITLRYEKPLGQFKATITGEIVQGILLSQRYNTTLYYSDRKERNTSSSTQEFKQWNSIAGISIGGFYSINNHAGITLELLANASLNDIIEAPISAKHMYTGLRLGYSISF